jgi:hypothetical protein
MTNIFAVIGEDRDDPDRLLVLGADGQHYAYHIAEGTTAPVELNDEWTFDPNPPPRDELIETE